MKEHAAHLLHAPAGHDVFIADWRSGRLTCSFCRQPIRPRTPLQRQRGASFHPSCALLHDRALARLRAARLAIDRARRG